MARVNFGCQLNWKWCCCEATKNHLRWEGGEENMILYFLLLHKLADRGTAGYFSTWVVSSPYPWVSTRNVFYKYSSSSFTSFNFIIEFFITFGSILGNFLLYWATNSLNSISCPTNYEHTPVAEEKEKGTRTLMWINYVEIYTLSRFLFIILQRKRKKPIEKHNIHSSVNFINYNQSFNACFII